MNQFNYVRKISVKIQFNSLVWFDSVQIKPYPFSSVLPNFYNN